MVVIQRWDFISKCENLICVDRPLSQFSHITDVDPFHQLEIANTTSIRTSAARFNLAAFGKNGFQHSLDVVITLWSSLIRDAATDSVCHQEDVVLVQLGDPSEEPLLSAMHCKLFPYHRAGRL